MRRPGSEDPHRHERKFQNSFNLAKMTTNGIVKFKCELCLKSFETRQGLLIHFGQQKASYFPCKEKFTEEQDHNKNMCLRVFKAERSFEIPLD